jgi:quinoprotein glucose dehydrogenase
VAERSIVNALAFIVFLGAWIAPASAEPIVGPAPQKVEDAFVPHPPGIRVTSWVEGLEVPWSLVFLPDGRALVSERPGRIRVIEGGRLRAEPMAVLEVAQDGEGGLMGLALHPRFPAEPYLYAMHTHRDARGTTNRVVRLKLESNAARFDRVIISGIPGARNHNGGRIGFGPDGMLYVGTGETFEAELAQDRDSLGGKLLRVTPEGGVPADNPTPGSLIFTSGHRNIQGLAWHPETSHLFTSEHGPSGEFGLGAFDEINVIAAGRNYGWPRTVGAPAQVPYVDPIVAWPDLTTPPAGTTFWRGDLFVATLRSQALVRIGIERTPGGWRATAIERWFAEGAQNGRFGRLRDAVVGPDGALYVLTSNRDGRGSPRPSDDNIYRLEPARRAASCRGSRAPPDSTRRRPSRTPGSGLAESRRPRECGSVVGRFGRARCCCASRWR